MEQNIHGKGLIPRATFIVMGFVFLIFFGRLGWLQGGRANYYRDLSDKNRVRVLKKHAPRGMILDRNGIPLVANRPTYTISLLPFEFKPRQEILARLSALTGVSTDTIKARFDEHRSLQYIPIPIARDVPFNVVIAINEHNEDFPGVISEIEPKRFYPRGSIAPHILGYVGEVSVDELRERYREGIVAGDFVGKTGLEREYDNILRGTDGVEYLQVRANGDVVGPLRDKDAIPPVRGADLITTIDYSLQQCTESLFASIPTGVFIALEPNTGEVLAMVSKPDFNLNTFTAPISDSVWSKLSDPNNRPLFNRAIQGTYPPASPMKIVTAAIALQEGYITPETHLEPCHGRMWYGDRFYKCWLHSGHGSLNLSEAIAQSCDIYFYQLGLMIGLDTYSQYAMLCRLNEPTGIDLPNEAQCFVPDRTFYNERYGRSGWGRGVVLNLVIGQGELLVTPLKMAQLVAAYANGGAIVKPHLLRRVESHSGRSIVIGSTSQGKLPFNEGVLKSVVDGMVRVVEEPWGTGSGAYLDGVKIAGKTGTAQNPHGENHAWFVSFAPADDPRVATVIFIEQGGSGASYAPLARMFYDYYFNIWEMGFARH